MRNRRTGFQKAYRWIILAILAIAILGYGISFAEQEVKGENHCEMSRQTNIKIHFQA
ncbi:MAG: hypothetical protein IKZ98_07030 [Clostridia bacterium]|nr:hypothetical protein [Clostridia bacterium]